MGKKYLTYYKNLIVEHGKGALPMILKITTKYYIQLKRNIVGLILPELIKR